MWGRDVPFTPVDTTFTGELDATPDDVKAPYGYFRELVNDKMLSNIRDQTNIYALEKNNEEMNVSVKEIEKFIGVYLRMGVMKAHCQRAYWAAKTLYPPVADVFSRSRYEQLASTIYFTDNNKPDANSRVWKLQPWLEDLKLNLEKIPTQENQSVNEIMVAFKGRSKLKQFMRNKPHRWGIKIWARVGHMIQYGSRQWCKLPSCHQKSHFYCIKCNMHLCINKDSFMEFHTKKKSNFSCAQRDKFVIYTFVFNKFRI
ncbi:PiggyBac transposable element-derived protein 4 [Plakobranchus ocellatus]|uniref:PiggyBac transposable element-derived protein 4 n=1 Tax=Plakobranchus ocellatus TaxID=259542 RepID=A0AAV4BNT6_9GAST|nr:PiggyBac transposable element-derived protein 4 [Plakobranchus ocellatus]